MSKKSKSREKRERVQKGENLEREVRDALWKQNEKDRERSGGIKEYGEDPNEEQV